MENRIEYMRPDQILAEQAKHNIIYQVFAPLEWHSPSMPFGTDPLLGQEITRRAAEKTGGVIMPTCFMGCDSELEPEMKAQIMKQSDKYDENTYWLGMDLPDNSVKSFYVRDEVMGIVIREQVRMMVEHGYKLIVLMSTHGGRAHREISKKIARETTEQTDATVIVPEFFAELGYEGERLGHANTGEQSLMMAITDGVVDLSKLPPLPQKLAYCDVGMLEGSDGDGYVQDDPRINASAELGERYYEAMSEAVVKQVFEALSEMGEK